LVERLPRGPGEHQTWPPASVHEWTAESTANQVLTSLRTAVLLMCISSDVGRGPRLIKGRRWSCPRQPPGVGTDRRWSMRWPSG